VCSSATKRTERHREREKETKLLKLKAGLCSILLFLDVQKPKAKLFGSHKCISLCCLFVWGVGVRIKKTKKNTEEEEEKKGRSFFLKDVQNPKRKTHQKTVTSFFSSFFSSSSSSFRRHSFHRIFEQTGLSFVWISLSLSLSLSLSST
jgi:hypothetical protein